MENFLKRHNPANPKDLYQVMGVNGKLKKKDYKVPMSKDQIIEAYEAIMLSRRQDFKQLQFQRQGRLLTFAPTMGQEALQIATGMAMRKKDDWFIPAFRSNALQLFLGWPMEMIMAFWNGTESGSKIPEGVNILPINIPIATQISHCAGMGFAFKYNKQDNIAVTYIGDGGTSQGEFYEGMNFAGKHGTNSVFVVQNNQWAISTPTKDQGKASTIAVKALAAGIPAFRCDGNDLFAAYEIMQHVIAKARKGEPSLVEFLTYRQGPHTTADNPRMYRTAEYEAEEMKKDPIIRLKKYMISTKIWSEEQDVALIKECDAKVMEAFKKMQGMMEVTIDDIFDYNYADINTVPELVEQKAEVKRIFGESEGNK